MRSEATQQTVEVPPILLRLIVPSTRLELGPLTMDPVARLLGKSLAELLAPLMMQPMTMARGANGRLVELYPLSIPDEAGFCLQLGGFGEVGLYADRGLLELVLPWSTESWVRSRLAGWIVGGPVASEPGPTGQSSARYWLRLERGQQFSLPLADFGEVGVEVG